MASVSDFILQAKTGWPDNITFNKILNERTRLWQEEKSREKPNRPSLQDK
jgi:hypothetical protein